MNDSVWAAAEYEWRAAALGLKSLRLQRALLIDGRDSSVLKHVNGQDTAMTWNRWGGNTRGCDARTLTRTCDCYTVGT